MLKRLGRNIERASTGSILLVFFSGAVCTFVNTMTGTEPGLVRINRAERRVANICRIRTKLVFTLSAKLFGRPTPHYSTQYWHSGVRTK